MSCKSYEENGYGLDLDHMLNIIREVGAELIVTVIGLLTLGCQPN